MTSNNSNVPIGTTSHLRWLAAVGLLLAAVITLIVLRSSGGQTGESAMPTFAVKQGPLTISVVEAGTIRPREQIILKNEVEGQTVILFLIDEGTEVKTGDLLVELDASQLIDQRVNQQIQVINAEAAFVNARENLAVVTSQAQADIDQAALDLQFARQDLEQYQAGEYPKLEKEAQAAITLAEETLTNAKNTYDWSLKLFEEKYISESELKKDELSWQKTKIDLELASDELNLLQNFTYKRRMAELKSAAKQTRMALERVKRKVAADVVQAEAKLKAGEAELKQQQDKFVKIETQIGKTKIYAPMDGTVIYASSTKLSWRSNSEPLDEGQAVRERQELIYLPTTTSYNAEIKVHESSLQKIRTGLPVRITVDALPDRVFSGRVAAIAPLPDATSMFINPDLKVYNSVIQVDGSGADLRNGMSCQAEIIIDRFENTLYVPMQAVIRVAGRTTVYVDRENKFVPQPVAIGLDNNRMVQILDGVQTGDLVLLTPPLADAAATADNRPTAADPSAAVQKTAEVNDSNNGSGKGLTPGQREQRRQQFEKMSPEEREAMRKQRPAANGSAEHSPGGEE